MDNPDVIAKIKVYEEQIAILETQFDNSKKMKTKYTIRQICIFCNNLLTAIYIL